jgi:hypothetical protein
MSKLIALILMLTLSACVDARNDRQALDRNSLTSCRSVTETVYSSWGERGLSKSCAENGKFSASEYGHLRFVGYFSNGKECGLWVFFDKKGKEKKKKFPSCDDRPVQ